MDAVDAKAAVEMVQYSHFQKVLEKPRKRKSGAGDEEGSDVDSEEEEEEMEVEESAPTASSSRRSEKRTRDVYEFDAETGDSQPQPTTRKPEAPKPKLIELSDERLKAFKQFLFKIFRKEMSQSILKSKVCECVRQEAEGDGDGKLNFTDDEVESALLKMQDNNQIFLSGDLVILV